MNTEKLLASSCRQKILKELSRARALHIMKLVRNINSTYIEVNRNLKILEREGVVNDQRVGRLRIIRLNPENPTTNLLLQALKILSKATKPKSATDTSAQIELSAQGHQ